MIYLIMFSTYSWPHNVDRYTDRWWLAWNDVIVAMTYFETLHREFRWSKIDLTTFSHANRLLGRDLNPGCPEYDRNIMYCTEIFRGHVHSAEDVPQFCRINTCLNLNHPCERSVITAVMCVRCIEHHQVIRQKNVTLLSYILKPSERYPLH
jgi:hypothetical protein